MIIVLYVITFDLIIRLISIMKHSVKYGVMNPVRYLANVAIYYIYAFAYNGSIKMIPVICSLGV